MAVRAARSKIGAPAVGGRPLGGGVEDLLEDPRNRQHERRLELAEPVDEVRHVAGVAQAYPALHTADLDDPGEDVRQRQEQQGGGILVEELGQLVGGHAQLEHEVAVGEHAALGAAGGAGGVDQGCEVQRRRRRTTRLQLVVGEVGADPGEHLDPVVLDRPDVAQLLEVGAHLGDPREVGGALRHHGGGTGVAQDPADLLGRGGLVDRHRHGAGEPDRVVEERPLVAGAGDQGDPVARLDPRGHQPLGHGPHLGEERRRGDIGPAVVGTTGQHDRVRVVGAVGDDVVGEVARGRDLGRERRGVLTHGVLQALGGDVARKAIVPVRYARWPWRSRPLPRSSSTRIPPP